VLGAVLMLALLAPSAEPLPIAVHLDDVQGLDAHEALELGAALRDGLERVTRRRAHLDELGGPRCERDAACLAAVRSRTGSGDVVLLQLIAAGTRVRLIAERAEPSGAVSQRVQADLRRNVRSLDGVAELLFPEAPARAASLDPAASLTPASPQSIPGSVEHGPWIAGGVVGAGALAAGVALALRVSSNAARDRAALPGADFDDERALSDGHGLASNVLLGVAAAMITGGVVYLFTAP
jgi:hypothetical protein